MKTYQYPITATTMAVNIENTRPIQRIAVFPPTGVAVWANLRTVNESLPFYNQSVTRGRLGKGGLNQAFVRVQTACVNVEGFLVIDVHSPVKFLGKKITICIIYG